MFKPMSVEHAFESNASKLQHTGYLGKPQAWNRSLPHPPKEAQCRAVMLDLFHNEWSSVNAYVENFAAKT
jgi:hypothetical protein